MEKCDYVQVNTKTWDYKLRKIGKVEERLEEIKGQITFYESSPKGLLIKLRETPEQKEGDKTIIWNEKIASLTAKCGQGLRCFYKPDEKEEIQMLAYELFEKNEDYDIEVTGRGKRNDNYQFISE